MVSGDRKCHMLLVHVYRVESNEKICQQKWRGKKRNEKGGRRTDE